MFIWLQNLFLPVKNISHRNLVKKTTKINVLFIQIHPLKYLKILKKRREFTVDRNTILQNQGIMNFYNKIILLNKTAYIYLSV